MRRGLAWRAARVPRLPGEGYSPSSPRHGPADRPDSARSGPARPDLIVTQVRLALAYTFRIFRRTHGLLKRTFFGEKCVFTYFHTRKSSALDYRPQHYALCWITCLRTIRIKFNPAGRLNLGFLKKDSFIRTPMLDQGRLELTETNLMNFKCKV